MRLTSQRRLKIVRTPPRHIDLGFSTYPRDLGRDSLADWVVAQETKQQLADAGARQINLLPALRDELAAYKAQAPDTASDGYVFATASEAQPKQGNLRRRVLDKAIERANERLTEAGEVPLPTGLTPHKLRHTFASILVALGVDPGAVMDQLGHTDPGFTLRVYRHGMRRDGAARDRLRMLVGGAEWAAMGSSEAQTPWPELTASHPRALNPA